MNLRPVGTCKAVFFVFLCGIRKTRKNSEHVQNYEISEHSEHAQQFEISEHAEHAQNSKNSEHVQSVTALIAPRINKEKILFPQ